MARLYGPGPGSPPPLVSTADLAGLSASDVEGTPVGELVGALSEERTGLIRYLDISIRDGQKHVLVPIGHARIDRESVPPRVRLRAATHDDLLAVPEFAPDATPLSPDYQEEVMGVYGELFYGSRYYAHPAYDHSALRVGDTPIIGTITPTAGKRLRLLSELSDFQLSPTGPELIGWSVVDAEGDTVASISDLLVEVGARRVRYAVLDLASFERSTVLPIGYLHADGDADRVRTPALTAEDIHLLPPYEPPLTRSEENRLHAAIEGRLSGERYFERADFRPNGVG